MTPLLIALQFLTRLPISLAGMPAPQQIGRSLLWYPVVGLLLGLWLVGLQQLLGDTPLPLQTALLLAVWVGSTGGLHLDGLADTADAWVGGFGDRQRSLEIMQDPRSGPIAVGHRGYHSGGFRGGRRDPEVPQDRALSPRPDRRPAAR
jgi:adenosylcobinamide-GDP ribazoletransferase